MNHGGTYIKRHFCALGRTVKNTTVVLSNNVDNMQKLGIKIYLKLRGFSGNNTFVFSF